MSWLRCVAMPGVNCDTAEYNTVYWDADDVKKSEAVRQVVRVTAGSNTVCWRRPRAIHQLSLLNISYADMNCSLYEKERFAQRDYPAHTTRLLASI